MCKDCEEEFGFAYAPDWQTDDMRLASMFYLDDYLPKHLAETFWGNKETFNFIEENKTDIFLSTEEVQCRIADTALMIRHYVDNGFTNTSKC